MINVPNKWLTVPNVLRPEDIASPLRWSLLFVGALNGLSLVNAFQSNDPGWQGVAFNTVFIMLVAIASLWLLSRNKSVWAIYVALIGNALVLAYAAWMGAGVNGVAYAALILPVLAAALFLGRRMGYIAAAIATTIGLLLFAAGRLGWLVNFERPITDTVAWFTNTIFFFLAAHQIGVSLNQVDRAFAFAQTEMEERRVAEHEVRRLNVELESRIAERTAQLAASEQRFRALVEQLPAITYTDDVKQLGRTLYISPQVKTILGYAPSDWMTGELDFWLSHIHADDRNRALAEFERCFRDGMPVESEYRMLAHDGRVVWFHDWATRLNNADGQPGLIQGVMIDITERKQAEAALVHERGLLQALMDNIPDIIYFKDSESRFTKINQAHAQLLGVATTAEAIGKTDLDFQSPGLAESFYAEEREMLRTGTPIIARLEYNPTRAGRPRWLTATKAPIRNAEGQIEGLVGISRDITEFKLAEQRESSRRAMLEKVIDLGKVVTHITDFNQCLREIHRSVQKGLGFDRVGLFLYDPVERKVTGTFGTSVDGEIEDTSWFSQSVDEHVGWQVPLRDPRGIYLVDEYNEVYEVAVGSEMRDVKQHVTLAAWAGEHPVALIAADNVASQRPFAAEQIESLQLFAGYAGLAIENARWNAELERRVAERTADLAAVNHELESLAYTIAHDLRTPARAINGFAAILQETHARQLDAEAIERLEIIRQSGLQMGQLVDDLLEYMRLVRTPLNRQSVNVTDLVTSLFNDLKSEQPDRSIELKLGSLPDCQADPGLLRSIWMQLLVNALKFTRPRAITQIEISSQVAEDGPCYFIRDNGVGFNMQYASKIFGAFQRLHHLHEFEGTGMGLAIVYRIVQRHGGRIWAEANEGRGAAFFFTLGKRSLI